MKKTYKRETALACLAFIAGLGINAVAADVFGYEATNTIAVLGILALPVMAFVAGMFGIDSYAKQISPPGQYPVQEYTDYKYDEGAL